MRPTLDDMLNAVRAMGAAGVVKYFPVEDISREVIVRELETMVPTVDALNWLVEQYIRRIGEWHSLKELRAVLCSHCAPADGIRVDSALPGYTPTDIAEQAERAYFERQSAATSRMLAERKLLPEYQDPLLEAELKRGIDELVAKNRRRVAAENIRQAINDRNRKPEEIPIYLKATK